MLRLSRHVILNVKKEKPRGMEVGGLYLSKLTLL